MQTKKIKQIDLAKQIGISPKHLSDIVCGRALPSRKTANLLEKATGIERLAWLYPDEYENPYINKEQSDDRIPKT